jgi:hypothetical protein
MILDRVTLTGADDSVDPRDLWPISQAFPFVEWGILYGSKPGKPRYPSVEWRGRLHNLAFARWHGLDVNLSAHLCSYWVRDFVLNGKYTFGESDDDRPGVYKRAQLNFHAHHHSASLAFIGAMRAVKGKEFIFQMDEVNDQLWSSAWMADLPAVPLFDTSGGAGIMPDAWPKPYKNVYCGYAGGLGPENLEGQLRAIAHAAPGDYRVWVDMETKIRSDDDLAFDLAKCRRVLEIAAPFIGRRV